MRSPRDPWTMPWPPGTTPTPPTPARSRGSSLAPAARRGRRCAQVQEHAAEHEEDRPVGFREGTRRGNVQRRAERAGPRRRARRRERPGPRAHAGSRSRQTSCRTRSPSPRVHRGATRTISSPRRDVPRVRTGGQREEAQAGEEEEEGKGRRRRRRPGASVGAGRRMSTSRWVSKPAGMLTHPNEASGGAGSTSSRTCSTHSAMRPQRHQRCGREGYRAQTR